MPNVELYAIPSELVRSAVHETIQTLTNSKDDQIKITSISEIVAYNASGNVYRVSFTTNGDANSSPSSLILKVSPQNMARRSLLYTRPCFLREMFIHDEVLPYFRKFEQSKGVNVDEDGFNAYPKCYRTLDVEQHECILLEDLNSRGFKMLDHDSKDITIDNVCLFLTALAKFHAISFAINDQQPDKFKQLTSSLTDIYMYKGNPVAEAYYALEAENVLRAVSGADDAHLYAKVKEYFADGALNVGIESIERELNESATVISFGDAYHCNTMFKCDSDGNPAEIRLIDWQLARHASPVIDFVYFVFSCTSKEMRDAHYEHLLKTYHDHLSAHIRRLGSDPDELFPYTTMLEHFQKFGRFGLILASITVPLLISDTDNVSSLNWDELSENFMKKQEVPTNMYMHSDTSIEKYNKRMRDIVIDLIDLEYI